MAGIEAHAEVAADHCLGIRAVALQDTRNFLGAGGEEDFLEESNRLGGSLEIAVRLGFEPEMDVATGVLTQSGEISHGGCEVVDEGADIALAVDPRLEGAGDGADAAVEFLREPRGEQVGELQGVVQAIGGSASRGA